MTAETINRHASDSVLQMLAEALGDRVSTASAVLDHHGHAEGWFPNAPPDVVVFAQSTEDVAAAVRICAETKTPVIAFGTGTSLEGHVAAIHGGVCIDVSQMNAVLEVNAEDLDCRVQAGVTRKQLNTELRDTGLFFPIDPGADASLGGMTSTRASGTNAVRYGTMRENVLGLTVVMADGAIIRTGGRAKKSAAGYDMTRLFVGSEGTLGIITEIQLRLYGVPEAMTSAVCQYTNVANAVNTVIETIQLGIPVARIEFLDEVQMDACIAYSHLDEYEARPTLFFEFHGTEDSASEQAEMVKGISDEYGGTAFQWTQHAEERNRLWQARHDAWYAALALAPGKKGIATDACVPISRLADCIEETRIDLDETGLLAPIVGHVGDGNFHLVILYDPDDPIETQKAKGVVDRLNMRAIAMQGTCTGEHGIGAGKISFLKAEHGETVAYMRLVKKALDPDDIMNPGKMFST